MHWKKWRAGSGSSANRQSDRIILFSELEEDVYELGWFFNKAYWRQGYAYESCRAVIDYAFCELKARKIFAETIDGVKSVSLMKKLGMQLEGIEQTKDCEGRRADLYVYGLQKDTYEKSQSL